MICKYCGAEIPEGEALCPACGKTVEAEVFPQKPAPYITEAPEKLRECPPEKSVKHSELPRDILFFLLLFAVMGVLCLGILRWKPTQKDTQTAQPEVLDPAVSDESTGTTMQPVTELAKNTGAVGSDVEGFDNVVAEYNGETLTNREYIYYYWDCFYSLYDSYGQYLSMYLDFNTPFDQQNASATQTWNEYIGDRAVETWYETRKLCALAEADNYQLSAEEQEYLTNAETSLAAYATQAGSPDPDSYLRKIFDPCADVESYLAYMKDTMTASSYSASKYDEIYNEIFDPNATQLFDVNVRHILFGIGEQGEYADLDAAMAKAEEVYALWQQDPTADNFASLAGEYSTDPGSASIGGLYEDVYPGQMVTEFNDWCFADGRAVGDSGIVSTNYGVHIMYLDGFSENAYSDENTENAQAQYNLWMEDLFSAANYTAYLENAVFTQKAN